MFDEDTFEDGLGFDGSSIRGWQVINNSDMLIIPDPTTAKLDPFTQIPTLIMLCKIVDPITKEPYSREPKKYCVKKGRKITCRRYRYCRYSLFWT